MILLGIDIGGTGIKGAPVNIETGELVAERFRIPTPQPALPNSVADVVGDIAKHFEYSGPVGVTFPAIVKKGVIYSASNVDESWIGTDASNLFQSHLGGSVTVVNDADAAGIAEMRFGAGRGRSGVVILLTFGTGIGSALFYEGKLLPNSELGHLEIRGKEVERRASEKVREDKDLSWKDWAERVSEYLEHLERLFSPEVFIIGGGVSNKADKFLPFLTSRTEVLIEAAQMRNEAGIIGAACLAAGSAPA
ncbi:MAG: polyphosphate--glucose phosphotransferase [Terrimicrobiaceae bacterium]|jgi:polyphosphate glucokinase